MKIFKFIILNIIVLFIILSCDKDTPYISNDIDSIQYYPNLKSLNSGENKYSSDIHWNKYTGEEALYEIFNNENNIIETITSKNDTSLSISMDLNEIKVVSLSVNTTDYGDIKIFTRSVNPISNFNINATSESNTLSWTRSTDSDIQQTIIYVAELSPGSNLPLINDTEGTPDESIWTNIKQGTSSLSSYTDSSINTSFNYYYIIKVIDSSGGYRYSYMNSNIDGAVEAGEIIGLSNCK